MTDDMKSTSIYENRNNEATKLLNIRMKALGAFTGSLVDWWI